MSYKAAAEFVGSHLRCSCLTITTASLTLLSRLILGKTERGVPEKSSATCLDFDRLVTEAQTVLHAAMCASPQSCCCVTADRILFGVASLHSAVQFYPPAICKVL